MFGLLMRTSQEPQDADEQPKPKAAATPKGKSKGKGKGKGKHGKQAAKLGNPGKASAAEGEAELPSQACPCSVQLFFGSLVHKPCANAPKAGNHTERDSCSAVSCATLGLFPAHARLCSLLAQAAQAQQLT